MHAIAATLDGSSDEEDAPLIKRVVGSIGEKTLNFMLGVSPHSGGAELDEPEVSDSDDEQEDETAAMRGVRFRIYKALDTAMKQMPSGADMVAGCISGIVCGLLMFVFCCVFAEIIYGTHPLLQKGLDLGVSQHTLTVLFAGAITILKSKNRIAIAGPDITPALFLAQGAKKVALYVEANQVRPARVFLSIMWVLSNLA